MPHLSDEHVARYRDRGLALRELLDADAHLSTCADCRDRVSAVLPMEARTSSLERALLGPESEATHHVAFEDLEAFVQNRMGESDREVFESHVDACELCREELRDLQRFAAGLGPAFGATRGRPVRVGWIAALADWIRRLLPPRIGPGVWLAAGLASSVLALGLTAWVYWQQPAFESQVAEAPVPDEPVSPAGEEPPEPAEVPVAPVPSSAAAGAEPIVSIADAGGTVALEEDGDITGLPGLRPEHLPLVRQALQDRRVELPAALAALTGTTGTLLGEADATFQVVEPVGTFVLSSRPTFEWQPLDGADRYVVEIYDADFNQLTASEPVTTTSWTPATGLPRGTALAWQVRAMRGQQELIAPAPPAPEARFEILTEASASALEQSLRPYTDSHLMRGLLYARAGLLDAAETELEALAAANPGSEVARQLVADVRAGAASRNRP